MTLPPKGGKSTTAAGMIAAATREGRRCAIISIDEALPDSLQRLVRFGVDLTKLYLTNEWSPETIGEECSTFSIEVLVLDHLAKLAEMNSDFGANSQGDPVLWGRLVSPFAELARSIDLSVILLDQARRSDGSWSGSVGKGGNVDIICELKPKDGGLVCSPMGRIPLPPFRVDLDEKGCPVFSNTQGDTPAPKRLNAVTGRDRLEVLRALQSAEPEGLTATGWQSLVKERSGIGRSSFFEIRRKLYDDHMVTHTSTFYRVAGKGTAALERGCTP